METFAIILITLLLGGFAYGTIMVAESQRKRDPEEENDDQEQ